MRQMGGGVATLLPRMLSCIFRCPVHRSVIIALLVARWLV